ncbi:ribbon-helix-helix protein, CopG family [Methanohalophilus portucalensis]|uniref:Uncharacterized protein n=1 Tax=Methanohalophilus portucalensis FDF-1 TaxID=523843 RepID=A0A1L9C2X4_9EURY|nr:ribbon-helix-helix protein, CopG family [Methanohalophilus portucalensis]OJH48768.1 hypothetical protein MPF_1815 [Methanohalophilus portucalensis FDF-1]
MKQRITITVDEDILPIFDEMANERMIAKSRLINQLIKNEIDKWKNTR